jgi:hypothetical protein
MLRYQPETRSARTPETAMAAVCVFGGSFAHISWLTSASQPKRANLEVDTI